MPHIANEKPVAVYNADTRALVGVFKHQWIVAKYLFGEHNNEVKRSQVSQALGRKHRICSSKYPARIALRFANATQTDLLNGEDYFIKDDSLLKFDSHLLNVYHSTRSELYKKQVRQHEKG